MVNVVLVLSLVFLGFGVIMALGKALIYGYIVEELGLHGAAGLALTLVHIQLWASVVITQVGGCV